MNNFHQEPDGSCESKLHWWSLFGVISIRWDIINELYFLEELTREEDVLEWLVQNKSTGDEEDVIEDVTAKTLNTLIGNIDNLVVLFCKSNLTESNVI